jgi:hypothetical protein
VLVVDAKDPQAQLPDRRVAHVAGHLLAWGRFYDTVSSKQIKIRMV